jgi:hypothetical protein
VVLSQFTKQHQEIGGGDGCADVWMIFFLSSTCALPGAERWLWAQQVLDVTTQQHNISIVQFTITMAAAVVPRPP